MDSTSNFGNFLDKHRYERCLGYLKHLDKNSDLSRYPRGYTHSVHMNGYLLLSISRKDMDEVTVLLRRRLDSCLLFIKTVVRLDEATISILIDEMIEKVLHQNKMPKCLSCSDIATNGKYCELCSLSQSTYKENPCSICLDEANVTTIWRKLPCHHLFHDECVLKMVKDNQITCPLCRQTCDRKDALIY